MQRGGDRLSDKMVGVISEQVAARYVELNEKAKKIKEEMDKLKHVFHSYFDENCGPNEKGELSVGNYFIQRQIRASDSYDDAKLVDKLEKLQLGDCIILEKKPNEQKIEAAIELGLLNREDISGYIISKRTQAISVKKTK
jgi:hypothetical protein